MNEIKERIIEFYNNYNIDIDIIDIVESLSITSYCAKVDTTQTNINKIEKLVNDLSLYICHENVAFSINYEKGCVIFEIPKTKRQILEYNKIKDFQEDNKNGLFVNIGMTTDNKIKNINLCKMPHLLIAGTTGSGKSMLVNTLLLQLFQNYSPAELQTILIDPKQVEFESYAEIPHLKTKIIKTLADAKIQFNNIIEEIEKRYTILKLNNTKNIENYNEKTIQKMPYILIVVDELADLLIQDNKSKLKIDLTGEKRLEDLICRVAQIGRAAGVHMILATQRPSSDVITGLIKANVPSRIALSTATATDSRIILDSKGAEKLTGNGDMLLKIIGNKNLIRLQGAYISEEQQESTIKEITNKNIKFINGIKEEQKEKEIETQNKQEIKDDTRQDKKEIIKEIIILSILIIVVLPIIILSITNHFIIMILYTLAVQIVCFILTIIYKLYQKSK